MVRGVNHGSGGKEIQVTNKCQPDFRFRIFDL